MGTFYSVQKENTHYNSLPYTITRRISLKNSGNWEKLKETLVNYKPTAKLRQN